MQRCGILLTNTGSPDLPTPEAVSVYLREFLSDSRICPMNPRIWNMILKLFILPKRAPVSAEKYSRIWTDAGSPLVATTSKLTKKLDLELYDLTDGEHLEPPYVVFAMSYGNPSIADVLFEMQEARCSDLVVVPMYPQSAFSTTLAATEKLEALLAKMDWQPHLHVIKDYWEHPSYIEAIASSLKDAGFCPDEDRLLFVFHSIPMNDIQAGDTYAASTRSTADNVAKMLGIANDRWSIGYESRFDNARMWLDPFVEQAASDLHSKSNSSDTPARLFVVAPNFSVDCLETHIDIEEELAGFCVRAGIVSDEGDFIYVPCLNDSDAHVKMLSSIIRDSLR